MKTLIKLSIIIIFLTSCQNMETNQICINNTCFEIEIADDNKERSEGLMYRTALEDNKGMLFIFDESYPHSVWMKNTFIPLDIIWINENLNIVWIEKNTPSCDNDPCPSYSSPEKAKYVLEINAGLAEEYGLKIDDKVDLKLSH